MQLVIKEPTSIRIAVNLGYLIRLNHTTLAALTPLKPRRNAS